MDKINEQDLKLKRLGEIILYNLNENPCHNN